MADSWFSRAFGWLWGALSELFKRDEGKYNKAKGQTRKIITAETDAPKGTEEVVKAVEEDLDKIGSRKERKKMKKLLRTFITAQDMAEADEAMIKLYARVLHFSNFLKAYNTFLVPVNGDFASWRANYPELKHAFKELMKFSEQYLYAFKDGKLEDFFNRYHKFESEILSKSDEIFKLYEKFEAKDKGKFDKRAKKRIEDRRGLIKKFDVNVYGVLKSLKELTKEKRDLFKSLLDDFESLYKESSYVKQTKNLEKYVAYVIKFLEAALKRRDKYYRQIDKLKSKVKKHRDKDVKEYGVSFKELAYKFMSFLLEEENSLRIVSKYSALTINFFLAVPDIKKQVEKSYEFFDKDDQEWFFKKYLKYIFMKVESFAKSEKDFAKALEDYRNEYKIALPEGQEAPEETAPESQRNAAKETVKAVEKDSEVIAAAQSSFAARIREETKK